MSKNHQSLPLKSNPHPNTDATARRYEGGNLVPEVGEVHGSKKAERIPAEKRFAGAEKTSLANSPGRVNEDVSGDN